MSGRRRNSKHQYSVLEDRRLLAVTANLDSGTLSIYGDSSDNSITVASSGNFLNITGDLTAQYNLADVTDIEFFGSDGDDFFENTTDIDTLAVGHLGNDELRTAGGTDRLFGSDGNDILVSTGGNDRLVGHDGMDMLYGGDGDDVIFGLGGNDELYGEAGNDTLVAGFGDDTIYGGSGDDTAYGHFGNDVIYGGADNDRLFGQDDDDTIHGEEGDDTVRGGRGLDTLNGNAGNDRALGDEDNDTINVGEGNDIVFAGSGDDTVHGGDGNDLLFANDGNDTVYGEGGNDVIRGNSGNDNLYGGANADRVAGDAGEDYIDGGLASDRVLGDAGNDTIVGDSSDRATGGTGDDEIRLGAGGTDSVNFSSNYANYYVTLNGDDLIVRDRFGFDGQDTISGAETFVFSDGSRAAAAEVTRRVTVQSIVVSDDNGSNTATFFGDAETELDIKRYIDEIYLQAGIDIEWETTRTTNNTFFNYGSGTGTRSQQDLPTIVTQGDNSGVGNSNPLVLDMYFVNRVPGFQELSANTANGLAYVDASGIAMHTGENLLAFSSGRAVVARVAAHEIAHNLGLGHVNDSNNLMDDGEELNTSQINAIRNSQFSLTI